jgi:polyferredoxin
VDVLRDRNALYRERPDETVENVYNVKILNKDARAHEFVITASGIPGIVVSYGSSTVWAGPGQVQGVPVRVRIPEDALEGGADIQVSIQATDAPELRATGKARFLAPSD